MAWKACETIDPYFAVHVISTHQINYYYVLLNSHLSLLHTLVGQSNGIQIAITDSIAFQGG